MHKLLSKFSLEGKVAVVTGGGSGIGKAVAIGFAEVGARVVVLDANADAAAEVAREIGGTASHVAANVARSEEVESAFAVINRAKGRVDVLFNNAGINRRSTTETLNLEDWDAVISVNMTGMLLCARNAMKLMKDGGTIINTASVLGLIGSTFPNIGYQATKGAVISMTRVWAMEWAAKKIRVNAIAHSIVRTAFTEQLLSQPGMVQQLVDGIPLGRLLEPEDVVTPVLFLASDASGMITGHTLPVDGGVLVR